MAGYMIAEVWCEHCGRREVADDEGTLREHRADLREEGWLRIRRNEGLIDVCPLCAEVIR